MVQDTMKTQQRILGMNEYLVTCLLILGTELKGLTAKPFINHDDHPTRAAS